MSSKKRRQQIEQERDSLMPSKPLDLKSADAALYGFGDIALDIAAADSQYQAIEAVDIFGIVPNLSQPRNVIPHDLSRIIKIVPNNMLTLFERWIKDVELERKSNFDILGYLRGEETTRGTQAEQLSEDDTPKNLPQMISSKEISLMKIVDLAASIRRDGLTNPISVVQRDGLYEIETGERRWLAYHMLFWKFGDSDLVDDNQPRNWSMIPSRIVRDINVWRQASENNARDNLNAIGKARQLALLVMDSYGWDNFRPFSDFEVEQDFYAQVSDGNDWRLKYRSGERVLNAMGFSDGGQLRQYRALLRINNELWCEADDRNLTEGEIRKIVQSSKSKSVTPVTVSDSSNKLNPVQKLAVDASTWRDKVRKQMDTNSKSKRKDLLVLLEDEIQQLQQLVYELDDVE